MTPDELYQIISLHPFGYATPEARPGNAGGRVVGVNGCPTEPPATLAGSVSVVWSYQSPDDWDGEAAGIIELADGRYLAWSSWWGPTGNGFSSDAYGGDTDIFYASTLADAINFGISEEDRRRLTAERPDLAHLVAQP